jgi:F420-dependent oxidoreductase-like protein
VSPTPVREALARVEADGLITKEPQRGYTVAPLLGMQQLRDLIELRMLIEPPAAAKAAKRASAAQTSALRAIALSAADAGARATAGNAAGAGRIDMTSDATFHHMVASLGGNPLMRGAWCVHHNHTMQLRIFTEPQQGATYDQLLTAARATEKGGFDGFFRSDHYLAMSATSGFPGPSDAWITLAGLARDTTRIRLGTMMTAATFRLPGPLAIAVAQVDAMSGGRIELGIGAGWHEEEHTAYGIPFPEITERFDRLEEQLAIISGLWATPLGDRFSHAGKYFSLRDSPALPKPVQQPGPPIIIGGTGARRTPELAARFAAEFNVPSSMPKLLTQQYGRVRDACAAIDRDPDSLVYSAVLNVCCGETDGEVSRRAANIGRDVDDLKAKAFAGRPADRPNSSNAWPQWPS